MTGRPCTVAWFRRDLRVADHPALHAAVARGRVVALFVIDIDLLARPEHGSPRRRAFLRASLEALDDELVRRGIRLVTRTGTPGAVLAAVAREANADRVHVTRDTGPFGRRREREAAAALAATGAPLVRFGGDLVAEPDDIPGPSGSGYRVFTPFHRRWETVPLPPHLPAPEHIEGPALPSDGLDALGRATSAIPAGPTAARERLVAVVRSGVADRYADGRDHLARDETSRLSPYLRFGACGAAQVGRALALDGPRGGSRAALWRQFAWREFAHHLVARRPDVLRHAMRSEFRAIEWNDDADGLSAWTEGMTGVPVVDAGMRQLAQTGWMHNRARMITASFLVKDLLIDWRAGERWFMRQLLDGDPAVNNLGWQWVAGTGTDAAPYFRVLNPVLQGKRFDPDGAYVRRFVPELAAVPTRAIHEPWRMTADEQRVSQCRIGADYPAPIVDHAGAKERVLARYRAASGDAGRAAPPDVPRADLVSE